MKTSRFSGSQIIAILKQAEAGSLVFYQWRTKFGGMDASLMVRLRELEEEKRRLKKMYAGERLKIQEVISAARDGAAGRSLRPSQY